MRLLFESAVEAGEIDGLGHLNVRYYQTRAQAACRALMGEIGLDAAALDSLGAQVSQVDTYTRYHREQFMGSTLQVRGGVLSIAPESLRFYFEVCNDAKGEVAATFILVQALVSRATRAPLPLPPAVSAAAADHIVTAPEHGQPRSVDLSPPRTDIRLEEVAARLGEESADPMSRRADRTLEAEGCDAYGFLLETQDIMFGQLRKTSDKNHTWGPLTFTTDEGHRFGWASLETRQVRIGQPRVGDTICSLGAEIGLQAKVRHSRRWIFNVTTGALLFANDNIALALDLDARRPIAIPSSVRTELEKRHLPEFA